MTLSAAAPAASVRSATDTLIYGTRWGEGAGTTQITYSFPDYGSSWSDPYGEYDEPRNGFAPLLPVQQAAVREALDRWAAVADVSFLEVADSGSDVGDMRFARTAMAHDAHAYLPASNAPSGDVWLGPLFTADLGYEPGSFGFYVLLHEIGHALGLKHPHDTDGAVLAASDDWIGLTVMSYRELPGAPLFTGMTNDLFPDTPMALDIAAIQEIYGANSSSSAGDTVYRWESGERVFTTIYDTGGSDTIDWSNQSIAAYIDLRPGAWSQLGEPIRTLGGKSVETLTIFEDTQIENAKGGSGNDRIVGNDLDNRLEGGDGNDRLWGLDGNDILVAGAGKDALFGGDGDDVLVAGPGKNILKGGLGEDRAVFGGDSEGFRIVVKKNGKAKVVDLDPSDGDYGKSKLVSIEILEFDDTLLAVGPGRSLVPLGGHAVAAAPDLESLVNDGQAVA